MFFKHMFWAKVIPIGTIAALLSGWLVMGSFAAGAFWALVAFLTLLSVRDFYLNRHFVFAGTLLSGVGGWYLGGIPAILSCALVGFLVQVGIHDYFLQSNHAILRNFPIIGWFRYGFELIGDELRQYWFMSDTEERPYDRRTRRYVYRSAKGINNNLGFGTQSRYRDVGQVHLMPAMFPIPDKEMSATLPPLIIGKKRRQPYHCPWPINISGMSWGSLSAEAVMALSSGGMEANIHMVTGEGGLTPYHLDGVVTRIRWHQRLKWHATNLLSLLTLRLLVKKPAALEQRKVGGARIVLQLGPAKFGFRRFFLDPVTTAEGREFRKRWSNELDWEALIKALESDQIVALEIKLAQGAKPGMGGKLPKEKITPEIAKWRGIPMGQDCYSPNAWDEFSNIPELFDFVSKLQERGGKPVGIKIAASSPSYVEEIAGRMKETGQGPDFITVDGGEGGTGAAPVALADTVGLPLLHALPVVDNILREHGVRDDVTLIASGKIATGADVAIHLAMGADMVNIGRAFLLAEGCIMALKCHTNKCPVGITTQDPDLRRGLDPEDKYVKVANYAKVLQRELITLLKSCGARTPWELTRHHVTVVREPFREESMVTLHPYPDGSDGKRNPALGTQTTEAA